MTVPASVLIGAAIVLTLAFLLLLMWLAGLLMEDDPPLHWLDEDEGRRIGAEQDDSLKRFAADCYRRTHRGSDDAA